MVMTDKLAVIFFGRCFPLSLRVLRAIAAAHRVVGVVESQPRGSRPRRGWRQLLDTTPAAVNIRRFAAKASIPYFLFTPERIEALCAFIESLQADVGVIAYTVQLLPTRIMALFPRGILNVHPSLLPQYRGPLPVFWAYYHLDRVSGVTVHFIDAGVDTGDIVKQARLPIAFGETGRSFLTRCAEVAASLVVEALDEMQRGTLERRPQNALSRPIRARFLRPGENPIAWHDWPIERIFHTLRGSDNLDLLPPRRFPLTLVRWRVTGYDKRAGGNVEPIIKWSGGRVCVVLRQGRIFLRPIPSFTQARRGLWAWRRRARNTS